MKKMVARIQLKIDEPIFIDSNNSNLVCLAFLVNGSRQNCNRLDFIFGGKSIFNLYSGLVFSIGNAFIYRQKWNILVSLTTLSIPKKDYKGGVRCKFYVFINVIPTENAHK